MSLLELSAVRKSYGAITAVNDVSLRVEAGSRMAIVGASGCGKTTLLRLIAGFEVPDAGSLALSGRTLADEGGMIPAHHRNIGYVPQDGALFPHLTVADNIGFGLRGPKALRKARVEELMDMVALDSRLLERSPHELSGGQQQRVALARALAQQPRLMLLDEPFSALDTGLRAATRKAVARVLEEAGVTTILVTHDQAEALSFADQLAVMRDGRLVQAGRPMDLYRYPVDEATASFLGEAIVLSAQLDDGWADCELGRIRIAKSPRRGHARIVLRPEQLQLGDVAEPPSDTPSVGVVTDIDFGGPTCQVTVILGAHAVRGHDDRVLVVRGSSQGAPAVGDRVRVSIAGQAHVLADSRDAADAMAGGG